MERVSSFMGNTEDKECPACQKTYTEKVEVEVEFITEAFEEADSSRDPCVSSPKGTEKAFIYYHD